MPGSVDCWVGELDLVLPSATERFEDCDHCHRIISVLFMSSWPGKEGWCELQGTLGSPVKCKHRVARTAISLDDKERYTYTGYMRLYYTDILWVGRKYVIHKVKCGCICGIRRMSNTGVYLRRICGVFVAHAPVRGVW